MDTRLVGMPSVFAILQAKIRKVVSVVCVGGFKFFFFVLFQNDYRIRIRNVIDVPHGQRSRLVYIYNVM
jgi:hypothetical protein